jgi:hypothetical protein
MATTKNYDVENKNLVYEKYIQLQCRNIHASFQNALNKYMNFFCYDTVISSPTITEGGWLSTGSTTIENT